MIETERLRLRRWTDADRPVYYDHCQDAEVMRYLGPLQTRAQTDAALDRQNGYIDSHGYSFWAAERRDDGALVGYCGLKPGKWPLEGEVEIGWRFGREYWRQGYAYEAASASLDWGWANLPIRTIWALTVPANRPSWNLMEKLGMTRRPDRDFDHPDLTVDDPLRPHIVYSIDRPVRR